MSESTDEVSRNIRNPDILLISTYHGGSHKQLTDQLTLWLPSERVHLLTLPPEKWHWTSRCGPLLLMPQLQPILHCRFRVIFADASLNLAEFLGLCPASLVGSAEKVLYFHENQLVYPRRQGTAVDSEQRDYQFGYNQIVSALVADHVFFNSDFNCLSFLGHVESYVNRIPLPTSHRPKGLADLLRAKCHVLHFPLMEPPPPELVPKVTPPLKILWPHRWEHDKNPEEFFEILIDMLEELNAEGIAQPFELYVVGEANRDPQRLPQIFHTAHERLISTIRQWGWLPRERYQELLSRCHVVVSTSLHEFFGVAMLEACLHGCFPLCPNRLVYPELFPAVCLYNSRNQLKKRLMKYCRNEIYLNSLRRLWAEQVLPHLPHVTVTKLKTRYLALFHISQSENNTG